MSEQIKKERDYLFDNCKVFLIFLVVVGHFIGPSVGNNVFLHVLKWVIFSFHMPAFIFVSGYFSKKAMSIKVLIERLAIPYLVYEVIYYLFYTFIMHKETGLYLLKPKFSLWYLMVLFFWRCITPWIKKIPYFMILAFAGGLLIGFSNIESNFMSIPRAFVFYPYFLAGTCFEKDMLVKLRNKKMKTISLISILIVFTGVAFASLHSRVSIKVFYGRYNYAYLQQGMFEGILWRIATYVIGFVIIYAMLSLLTDKKRFYSYIGARTMAIYFLHGIIYTYLEYCTSILDGITSALGTTLLIGSCALLTLICSWRPFTVVTNKISNLISGK